MRSRAQPRAVFAVACGALPHTQITVVQYLANGALDLQFGTNGVVSTNYDVDLNKDVNGIAELPDGSLLIAGSSADGGGVEDLLLARFTVDGQVDLTFAPEGIITDDLNAGPEEYVFVWDMVLDPQDRPIITGSVDNEPAEGFVVRYSSDGERDPTLGFDGLVNTILTAEGTSFGALALQPDGKILVAGRSGSDPVLVRYTNTGALDLSFGGNGSVVHSLGDLQYGYSEMALDPSGRILLAGLDYDLAEGYGIFIARAYNDVGLGVADPEITGWNVALSPNPIVDHAEFTFELTQQERLTAEIHDAHGKVVRTLFTDRLCPSGKYLETVDLTGLASANYTLVLTNGKGSTAVRACKATP